MGFKQCIANKNVISFLALTKILGFILVPGLLLFLYLTNITHQHKNILIIFFISTIGGGFGGYVAFYRENLKFEYHLIKEKIITGIACGNLIPLFLNTISSTLLTDPKNKALNYYIFLGIVVITAIFSNDFLSMMKKKVLVEKDAEVQKLKAEILEIREQQSENGFKKNDDKPQMKKNEQLDALIN